MQKILSHLIRIFSPNSSSMEWIQWVRWIQWIRWIQCSSKWIQCSSKWIRWTRWIWCKWWCNSRISWTTLGKTIKCFNNNNNTWTIAKIKWITCLNRIMKFNNHSEESDRRRESPTNQTPTTTGAITMDKANYHHKTLLKKTRKTWFPHV